MYDPKVRRSNATLALRRGAEPDALQVLDRVHVDHCSVALQSVAVWRPRAPDILPSGHFSVHARLVVSGALLGHAQRASHRAQPV